MGEHGGGRDVSSALATDNPKMGGGASCAKAALYRITLLNGGKSSLKAVKGRVAWALDRLISGGPKGCTPIEEPGPRWSAYVHTLRRLGVAIETLHERHGGDYPGGHARYVLRCDVRRVDL